MPPEVTAVITTHARPAHVYDALASVQAETYESIEIVVVDDGGSFVAPSDDSGRPVRVVSGASLGVARARNLGLGAARGEFLIFLDDDDVALPHRIASLLREARLHDASLCFGMTRRVTEDGTPVLADVPTHGIAAGPVGFCDLLACAPHINAVLVRTDVLRAVGGFDTDADHFDEWSAWLRIADRGAAIRRVANTVAEWRIHPAGLSGRVLQNGAMKARLLALFERLQPDLSSENAVAVAAAGRIVADAPIVTYDDYADVMANARQALHAQGAVERISEVGGMGLPARAQALFVNLEEGRKSLSSAHGELPRPSS